MKIIISEKMSSSGISRLNIMGQVEEIPDLWANKEKLINEMIEADALIVRNQTIVDRNVITAAKRLKVIGRLGVGLDNIDLQAANQQKVKIVSAQNANSISVAEYVMSAILNANRSLSIAAEDVNLGNWNRQRFTGNEIYGKTLGLVGTGDIGHRIAKRALAFGMKVVGYDPYLHDLSFPFVETGIEKIPFHQLLLESDFISIHTPLTLETRSMFSSPEFNLMKKEAFLINTSRGGIVNEHALLEAVESGEITGAYLDVLDKEPVEPDHFLLNNKRIIITPHIAGLTTESQERVTNMICEEVVKVLKGMDSLMVVK
ncbi:hydroxyacid dehydrogenase [Neobacillus sp. CF12]|uniref:hydroxyacid dehydrogenase n=1 Tax=Neobacillus sp. CF12 TaxID=3055864 RepID=UPI0025A22A99|nr:hydroxyacid dehydrogenase [Neobacillus sp. CF12]MDM5329300.1 hydroxyacid dehydrogenase [Neobacillus sp. CF12]